MRTRNVQDQVRKTACVYFWDFGRLVAKENKNQRLKTCRSSKRQACWWQVRLRARWIPVIKHEWPAEQPPGVCLDVTLHDDLGVHLLFMAGMHGHHRPASQPVYCPMDAWLLSASQDRIGEVTAMSISCLTLEKTSLSPSHTDSVARRSSGRGAVFFRVGNPYVGLGLCWQGHPICHKCMYSYPSHLELQSWVSSLSPVRVTRPTVQADNMAASRPVDSLLEGRGSHLSESGPFQTWCEHRRTTCRCATTSGVRGMLSWGNFTIMGLRRVPSCILGLDFEENVTF